MYTDANKLSADINGASLFGAVPRGPLTLQRLVCWLFLATQCTQWPFSRLEDSALEDPLAGSEIVQTLRCVYQGNEALYRVVFSLDGWV